MNSYPIWWDSDITVYNKYTDPQTQVVMWFRTVLSNCFWKHTGDKVAIGNTVLETDNIICRIPKSEKYLEPYEWVKVTNDNMGNYFTLGVGDIVVKGIIDEDIDEYTKGKRSSDFLKKYKDMQGCMEIQRVAINVGAGRGNEHYYVKGI